MWESTWTRDVACGVATFGAPCDRLLRVWATTVGRWPRIVGPLGACPLAGVAAAALVTDAEPRVSPLAAGFTVSRLAVRGLVAAPLCLAVAVRPAGCTSATFTV